MLTVVDQRLARPQKNYLQSPSLPLEESKKFKLNIFYYTYPWAFDVPGGGERQMVSYRQHLAKWGINAQLFDMWRPDFSDGGIFHCFSVMPGVVEICDYARKRGLKLVISPNLWVTHESKSRYPAQVIWNLFEMADAIVVNSEIEKNTLSDVFGFPVEKFHVVYNAAETEFLLSENPALFRDAFGIRMPYVLNIANIEPRKNQLNFLTALRQERPDLALVVIGHERDQEYAAACRAVGGDRLITIGPQPYASPMIRSALSGCEFFAMPSALETPSIAAIEAAAAGVRVLLTEVGSTVEYFQQSVTYVTPDSLPSIAAGISEIKNATAENSTWVARNGYLWPKVIPSLIEIYRSL